MHNQAQDNAIRFGSGPLLLLAGPGSGKTYVITHRIYYLISECKIPPNDILVITFTKSAALEMQDRAKKLSTGCAYVQFGTFHSIFYHILKLSNPQQTYELIKDAERLEFVRSYLKNEPGVCPNKGDLSLEVENAIKYISLHKSAIPQSDDSKWRNEENGIMKYEKLYAHYNQWLKDSKKIDFDDMILLCYQLLKQNAAIREYWKNRFSHILIDEFQDINSLQYETLKLLDNGAHNYFAVGDDDQAIYSFRGARPELMQQFEKDFQATVLNLSVNYRSVQDIVDLAADFIKNNQNRFEKNVIASQGCCLQSVQMIQAENKQDMLAILKKEVHKFAKEYPTLHQAILCRTNGLLYTYQNMDQFSSSAQMLEQDLLSYLLFINMGQKRKDFLNIMNKPVRFISPGILIDEIVDFSKLKRRLRDKIWIAQRISELEKQVEYIRNLDLRTQCRYIYKAMGYEDYYLEQMSEKTVSDKRKVAEQAFHEFMDIVSDCSALSEVQRCIKQNKKCNIEKLNLTTMTYHASKGLEFDRVYLPDLDYGKVPHGRMLTREELEEERRMFYVAMTRAKKSLWLLCDKSQTGSPFLQELKINQNFKL